MYVFVIRKAYSQQIKAGYAALKIIDDCVNKGQFGQNTFKRAMTFTPEFHITLGTYRNLFKSFQITRRRRKNHVWPLVSLIAFLRNFLE